MNEENEDDQIENLIQLDGVALENLDDNVLSLILEKLPLNTLAKLSCTNKRMHKLCHNPQFWSSVRICDSNSDITPYNIAVLCGKGSQIKRLCIDLHSKRLPKSVLSYLSSSCHSVISLSLFISAESSTSRSPGTNIFPIEELINFLTNSKYVRALKFVDSLLIDDSHLMHVLPHLQMMREINLSGCVSLSDSSLIKLAQQCPSLQVLDISRLPITGRCIEQIFRYCGGILVLRANRCPEFQSDSFQHVTPESLKSLFELSVIETPVSLEGALRYCVNLRSLLASSSLHDSILIPFLMENRSLEVLHMGSGCRVTISSLLTAIQTCGRRLRSLTFHPFDDFAVPSDETFRLICQCCPNLKNLSIAHTQEVSTYWVIEALKKLPLESLALFGWVNGNGSSLRLIAPHVGKLRMLCLTGCVRLKPAGVVRFLKQVPGLRVAKFEATGANLPDGTLDPSIIEELTPLYPDIHEAEPGTLFLR